MSFSPRSTVGSAPNDTGHRLGQSPNEPLAIDPTRPVPHGPPCAACGCPLDPGDRFCPACRSPISEDTFKWPDPKGDRSASSAPSEPQRDRSAEAPGQFAPNGSSVGGTQASQDGAKHLRCDTCGSEIVADANERSFSCPFCDSNYVVEYDARSSKRQRPEFVIGFAISPEQARAEFKKWLKESRWFNPPDLSVAAVADKMRGVYLPFWSFTMLAESEWTANIGEYWYRTETYTVTDREGHTQVMTRQVQETEWWPLSGRRHEYHSGYLVSGSRGLRQDVAMRVMPFQLPALKRYQPFFLAGWLSEEYSVSREDALRMSMEEFQRQEYARTAQFLPGDTHQGLVVNTRFDKVNSDLCLLPVYLVSYRYKTKLYRYLINGQTGKSDGDKPVSGVRVAIAVVTTLVAIAVVVLLATIGLRGR